MPVAADFLRPFIRRTFEVLFGGSPEAVEDLEIAVKQRKDEIAKARPRLQVPPDAAVISNSRSAIRTRRLANSR